MLVFYNKLESNVFTQIEPGSFRDSNILLLGLSCSEIRGIVDISKRNVWQGSLDSVS